MLTLISDNFESGIGGWNTFGDVSLIDTSRGKSVQLNLLPGADTVINQNVPINNNDLSIKLALNTNLSVIGNSRYLVDINGSGTDNSNHPFELLCIRNSSISECSLISLDPLYADEHIPVGQGGSESFRIPLNLEDFADINGWVELNLIIRNYDANYKMGTLFVNNNRITSGLMYQYNGLFTFSVSVWNHGTILNSQARVIIDDVLVEIPEVIQLTNSPYGLIEVADFKVYGNNVYYIWYDTINNQTQIFTGTSNLDGSGFVSDQRTFNTADKTNPSIQIANNKIYYLYGDYYSNILTAWFMEETGWNEVTFITSTPTYSADFKVTADKIYYIYSGDGTLWTATSNLDGSNFVETFRGNYYPVFSFYRLGPQIEVSDTKIYCTWADGDFWTLGNLWTAISDLDGSNFVVVQRTSDRHILDPQIQMANNKVYYTWSDYIDNQIYTATSNLDGTGWNIITQTSSITTTGKDNVQFRVVNDRIYYIWSNRDNLGILDLYTAQFDPVTGMTETLKIANNNDNVFPKLQAESGSVKLYYVWLGDINRTNNWQIFFTTETLPGPPVCPSTPKFSGDTVHLKATPKDGIGPYSVTFKKGTTIIASSSNVVENTDVTYDYILTDTDIAGSGGTIIFSVLISDKCPTGAKSCTQDCTINIGCVAPICNFTVT